MTNSSNAPVNRLRRSNGANSQYLPAKASRFTLWVDGVGAYMLFLGNEITIGGPAHAAEAAEIRLLANLSRRHATIVRKGEGYLLEAQGEVRVNGRSVENQAYLNDGYEIILGESVGLRFRMPTVLSATATLDFISEHRPMQNIDGMILMEETCLLGPGGDHHVRCPAWTDAVLLFRKNDEFCLKSQSPIFIDGDPLGTDGRLPAGKVVSGTDFRFRVEPMPLIA